MNWRKKYDKGCYMLSSVDGNSIKLVWHKKFFDACKSRLSDDEYLAMIQELTLVVQDRIDNDINIVVSSFIPGSNWSDKVWEPIYTKACTCDEEHSAQFFGLLVCQILIDRDEKWYFLKQDIARGMTYFKDKDRNKLDLLQEKFGG